MRHILFFILALLLGMPAVAQDSLRYEVLFETNKGNIRIALYNETPLHRDNFLKNVREGLYDGLLFHRVISKFMIQTGDTASRHAQPGQLLGETAETYTVPAEWLLPVRVMLTTQNATRLCVSSTSFMAYVTATPCSTGLSRNST